MKPIKQINKQTKKTPMHSTTHYSHLSVETVELSAAQKTLAKERDEKRGAKDGRKLERTARIIELAERLAMVRRGFSFLAISQ